jgi:hypothetical protein
VTHFPSLSLMRGAEDYRAGVPREACPFKGGADRVLWFRGVADAEGALPEDAQMSDFDEDDWQDLEKPAPGNIKPDATVRLGRSAGRHGKGDKFRASLVLRHAAAEWAKSKGPRFRVQIGGPNANGIRIVPDAERGQYEPVEFHGVLRFNLGVVTVWPNQERPETEAKWRETTGGLVLTLPDDFAKAGTGQVLIAPQVPPPQQKPEPKPPAFPITTQARGLERQAKAAAQMQRRDVSSSLMGDPAPSRSALAQRGKA